MDVKSDVFHNLSKLLEAMTSLSDEVLLSDTGHNSTITENKEDIDAGCNDYVFEANGYDVDLVALTINTDQLQEFPAMQMITLQNRSIMNADARGSIFVGEY